MNDVKQPPAGTEIRWEDCIQLLDELPALPVASRRSVIERLLRTTSPGIRDRALQMGAQLFTDDQITALLRDDADDVMRNAGLEMLKKRGGKGYALATELLNDSDPDVVLQAILVLDHLRDPRAFEALRPVLTVSDTNLVQAAIVAIGHLGDSRAIPDLVPFLKREIWLQLAAMNALGDIRSPRAVPALKKLLVHEDIAPLVLEALARIGGGPVFAVIANYWMKRAGQPDSEKPLGLLAHVAEGLRKNPPVNEAFRALLANLLHGDWADAKLYAARCLLVLGPGSDDIAALHVLKDAFADAPELPACLARRRDLSGFLLSQEGILLRWGLLLSAGMAAKEIAAGAVAGVVGRIAKQSACGDCPDSDTIDTVLKILDKLKDEQLARPLLDLYLALPPGRRIRLVPQIYRFREKIIPLLKGIEPAALLVLRSITGESADAIVSGLIGMKDDEKIAVIEQLAGNKQVLGRLPWAEWLDSAPERYIQVAAVAASNARLSGLIKLLRGILRKEPNVAIIKAAGEARDKESVPLLIDHLPGAEPVVRTFIIESLGKIGGEHAREALKQIARSDDPKDSRLAYKSLAQCAMAEDAAFFREAVTSSDWFVRLSCVDILGRFRSQANLAVLAQLASDPVNIVAQRALSFLDAADPAA